MARYFDITNGIVVRQISTSISGGDEPELKFCVVCDELRRFANQDVFNYALKKLKGGLKQCKNVYDLFTNKDNVQYRKDFYELSISEHFDNNNTFFYSYKEFCENFKLTREREIHEFEEMIKHCEEMIELREKTKRKCK